VKNTKRKNREEGKKRKEKENAKSEKHIVLRLRIEQHNKPLSLHLGLENGKN
jgi:hypothetical protein